jgi:hypothetical protein
MQMRQEQQKQQYLMGSSIPYNMQPSYMPGWWMLYLVYLLVNWSHFLWYFFKSQSMCIVNSWEHILYYNGKLLRI